METSKALQEAGEEFIKSIGWEKDGTFIPTDMLKCVIFGANWQSQQSEPLHLCPKCFGRGTLLANGSTTSIYMMCDLCNGSKVIPPLTR